MSDPSLPTELKWIIAEHLCGDEATLSALSLVSKDWLVPSQTSLFSQIAPKITSPRTLTNMISFFTAYPHFAACTRRLLLRDGELESPHIELQFDEILSLISLMPNLHALTLDDCRIVSSKPSDLYATFRHPCNLVVQDVFIDIQTLALLCSCLAGHTLILGATADVFGWVDPKSFKFIPPQSFSDMRALDISKLSDSVELESLADPWPMIILRSCSDQLRSVGLPLTLNMQSEMCMSWEFLKTKGRHIEHLRLDMSETFILAHENLILSSESDEFGGIPLGWEYGCLSETSPNLKSITLVLFANSPDIYNHNRDTSRATLLQWRYALRLLSSCPLTVTHIFVEFWTLSSHVPDRTLAIAGLVDWKEWNEVLGRFGNLESFRFVAPGTHWVEGHGETCEFEPSTTEFVLNWEAYVREWFTSPRLRSMEHFA
ncbi:hypothetical protein EIP91_010350 [Steccherinum ochraceum]|uniref:F-box domain-containing protein n=1 Tax=Steccherinum ochraceum TaxID=92696 RepID=A0A4R0R2X4_9APHY|nr:hypothetical protein EIP91_010350 [Steccherinum ochraceum]